ncbi:MULTISPECIES: hypothetical protein [unclassified Streptomyces]|uniref:hypothetical protein n=1 Tax=unclassified Streptomyces TaxID=2593676 RepID=UPI00371DEC10
MGDVEKGVPDGWWIEGDKQADGIFVAETDEAVPPNAELQFVFNGIPVNSRPGQAQLVISELTDGTITAETTLLVAKADATFLLRRFAPGLADVQAGDVTDLRWDCHLPSGSSLQVLSSSGPPQNVTGKTTCKTPRLYQDTSFALLATVPVKGEKVTYALGAFVTVNNGYLDTGSLKVEGTFSAMGSRHPTSLPALPAGTFDGSPHRRQAVAETDGLLIGSLRSFTQEAKGSMEITVRSPESDHDHVTVLGCEGPGAPNPYAMGRPVLIPVPKDSAVIMAWTMSAPDWPPTSSKRDATIPFAAPFRWHPWGNGALQFDDPLADLSVLTAQLSPEHT